jgi:phytoene dehydrogenase-like protein
VKVGIVGGGHNSLVLAGYLAKEDFDITVYEARDRVGGLCVNEELFPGHIISPVASYFGMFRRQIIEDLQLDAHGLQPYLTDPAEIVLLPNGGYSFTPRDGSDTKISAGELTDEELAGWRNFWGEIGRGAALVGPYYFKPETTQQELVDLLRANGMDFLASKLFDGSLFEVFDHFCKNQSLKAAVATCTPGYASNKGSVFGCMHHGTAETCGVPGAWGLVRGGMGMVSESLRRSAESRGVKVLTNQRVSAIVVENGRATGLRLASGEIVPYDLIVSGTDPITTFKRLLADVTLPAAVVEQVEAPITQVSAAKIHFRLKRLPTFPILNQLSHNYSGIIVVAPPAADVIADSKRVLNGQMPLSLMMTMAFPTVTDETVAPAGEHHMNIDVHQMPRTNEGQPWTEQTKSKISDAVIEALKPFAPDIAEVIEDTFVISPTDINDRYNVLTGMCWHLPMTDEYAFDKRNVTGCEPYGSPIENLYLCGAGTYGGGNVTGVSGFNCAKILQNQKARVLK